MDLLKEGNSKLGRSVGSFSIPAEQTCPGATKSCLDVCYACSGFYRMPNVKESLQKSFEVSMTKEFVSDIVMTIRLQRYQLVRIHASGDFYSAEYIRKWIEICKKSPQTKFLAYTRTWRCDYLLAALHELAQLPNMFLWLSADQDTGEPPMRGYPYSGVAYMATTDNDIPQYPVELVFRNESRGVMRFADTPVRESLVCPAEQGTGIKMTCAQCRFCFNRRERVRWKADRDRPVRSTLPPLARHVPVVLKSRGRVGLPVLS